MEKFIKLLPIMLCLLFTGCHVPQTPKSRLVTEMKVEVYQEQDSLYRRYTDPQKMETVLSYLRALQGHAHCCSTPERYAGPRYRIELYYSDGSTCYIFQHADRFLSREFQPWQEINTKHAAFLLPLIKSMPGD